MSMDLAGSYTARKVLDVLVLEIRKALPEKEEVSLSDHIPETSPQDYNEKYMIWLGEQLSATDTVEGSW